MRSFAGRPSIVESIVICASTRGAPGTGEGSSRTIRSTLPTLTPARRTSEPSRRPFASEKCALKCSLLLKGLMSPEALSTRKISTLSRQARKSRLATGSDLHSFSLEAWSLSGMKSYIEPFTLILSLMSPQKLLDVRIFRTTQRLVRTTKDYLSLHASS